MPGELEQMLNSFQEQMDSDTVKKGARLRSEFVNNIKSITDYFQTLRQRDSLGRRQMVGAKEKAALIALYDKAIRKAKTAAKNSDYRSVNIITEIQDILTRDLKTIQSLKPEENLSIDDTLDRSRTKTVVVTDENLKKVGAQMSVRMPMTITGRNGEQISGFFTEESKVSVEARLFELFSELGKVNPKFEQFGRDYYRSIADQTGPEEKGREALFFLRIILERANSAQLKQQIPADFPNDDLSRKILAFESFYKEKADPDYKIGDLSNIDSLYLAMLDNSKLLTTAFAQSGMYLNQLNAKEGASIDKRNTAMSKVADLLGVSHLIARSENMDVIVNGKKVKGTFMANARGLDVDRLPKKHPAYSIPPDKQSGAGFKDICDIQVLDYICGNLDRHASNLFYQFDENGMFTGVQGIDNDASFGTVANKTGKNRMAGPMEMPYISRSMATAVSNLTGEMLRFALEGNGLNELQIQAAILRLSYMQNAIGKAKGPTILDDAEFKNKSAQFFMNAAVKKGSTANYTYSVAARQIEKLKAPFVGASEIKHAKAAQGVLSDEVLNNAGETFTKALTEFDAQFTKPEMQALLGKDGMKTVAGIRETLNHISWYTRQLKKNPNNQFAAVRAETCAQKLTKQSKELLERLNSLPPEKMTRQARDNATYAIEKVSSAAGKQIPVLKETSKIHNKNTERSIDSNASELAKAMEKIDKMSAYQGSIYEMVKGRPVMETTGKDKEKPNKGKRVPKIRKISTAKEAKQLCKAIREINKIMKNNGPDDPSNSTGQVLIRDALLVLKSSATIEFNPQKAGGLTQDDLDQCKITMQKGLTAAHESAEKQHEAEQLTQGMSL